MSRNDKNIIDLLREGWTLTQELYGYNPIFLSKDNQTMQISLSTLARLITSGKVHGEWQPAGYFLFKLKEAN